MADDHEDANGESVMTYWQVLEKAKALARAGEGNSEQPISVSAAVDMRPISNRAAGASTMALSFGCISPTR